MPIEADHLVVAVSGDHLVALSQAQLVALRDGHAHGGQEARLQGMLGGTVCGSFYYRNAVSVREHNSLKPLDPGNQLKKVLFQFLQWNRKVSRVRMNMNFYWAHLTRQK